MSLPLRAFLLLELQAVARRLLPSGLAGAPRAVPLLQVLLTAARTEARRTTQLPLAFDAHLLVVGNWGWWAIPLSDRDDVIDDHPRVVSTREDPVDVLRTDVGYVLERGPGVLVIQAELSVSTIACCEDVTLLGEDEGVVPPSSDVVQRLVH